MVTARAWIGRTLAELRHNLPGFGVRVRALFRGGHELPLLPGAVAACPLRDACAIIGGQVEDIDHLAAVAIHEHVRGARIDGLGSCTHRRERERERERD